MLDLHSKKILLILLEKSQKKEELKTTLNFSERQLTYSIRKIDDFLLKNNMSPVLIDNGILSITEKNKKFIITKINNGEIFKNYVFSSEERQKYIFLILFYYTDDYLSTQHFLNALSISKTTFNNDLKQLEYELSLNKISLNYNRENGYFLKGDELAMRHYFLSALLKDFSNREAFLLYDIFIYQEGIDKRKITKELDIIFKEFFISISENRKKEFYYIFIFLLKRTKKNNLRNIHLITKDFSNIITELNEYVAVKKIAHIFKIKSENETLYITSLLLGNSIGNVDVSTSDKELISNITQIILSRFEQLAGVCLNDQNKVYRQIYNHLRPTYYRLIFKLPIINPILDDVKENFEKLFIIVKESFKAIQSIVNIEIPDDEISFLTLYFASLLDDNNKSIANHKSIAVVICSNGIGRSSIIYNELIQIFPDIILLGPMETDDILNYKGSYDLIFSTVNNLDLYTQTKPVFLVNPIMSFDDKIELIEHVYRIIPSHPMSPNIEELLDIFQKNGSIKNEKKLKKELYNYVYPQSKNFENFIPLREISSIKLLDLVDENTISLNINSKNWKDALRLSASPLIKKNMIEGRYIEKIIENIDREGPYVIISDAVALVHAKPEDGVNQLSMSISTLKEPVMIKQECDNNPVKFIFTLAAIDKTSHIQAMSDLVSLLENESFLNFLDEAKDPKEVINFIKEILT